MNRLKQFSGVLITFTGVFLFSAKAILVKLCYNLHQVDTITMLALRMGFALPVFLVIGYFKSEKEKQKVEGKNIFIVILLGTLGYYGASYFDFEGLQFVDASLERLILFSYPTIVVILSALVYKQKIKPSQVIAILATYFGMCVIFLPTIIHHDIKYSAWGVILIIMSGITYASYLVASQHFVPKFGSIRFTTWAMSVSCLMVLLHFGLDPKAHILNLDSEVYLYGFLMAIFCTVLPSYMISEGIRQIGAPKVGIIGSVGPVATIALSILILNEQMNIYQFIGGSIIVTAVVWLNYQKK
jgi:drug/metabolite transporter (DMT)-like permease